jgi:hypothetical protein
MVGSDRGGLSSIWWIEAEPPMRRKQRVTQIRVRFIDPSGKQVGEIIQPIDRRKTRRKLDHQNWNCDQAVERFAWYLARGDHDGVKASYEALKRLGCIDKALRRCARGPKPNARKTGGLLSLWNEFGLWSLPRSLGDDLAILTDAIKHFAPPYTGTALTLYRGQSLSRYERGVFGIAWTGRLEKAQQFARLRDDPGVVLELDATPDLIVAHVPQFISAPKTNPASRLEFEDEYLVGPRGLAGRVRIHSK